MLSKCHPCLHPAPPPPPLQGVNYCIQNGAHLSRAKVLYFKHNDPADLERLLKQQADLDRKQRWVAGWGRCPGLGWVALVVW